MYPFCDPLKLASNTVKLHAFELACTNVQNKHMAKVM
jgi:hypothetical protein